jgi:hypothetical protein
MTIEMTMLEVMDVWCMLSHLKGVRQEQLDDIKTDSTVYDYFKSELDKVANAESKLEQLLLAECKVLDEARDWVINYKTNAQI